MSTYNVHEVLRAIQSAATAFDEVPTLRRRIDELEMSNSVIASGRTSAQIERDAAKAKIEELEANLCKMTEERDQYGFRNLELEEQLGKVREVIGKAATEAREVAAPPAVAEPEPVTTTVTSVTGSHTGPFDTSASPTTGATDTGAGSTTLTTSDGGQATSTVTAEYVEPSGSGRFAGRAPWEKPSDVTWGEFIDNGGTAPTWDYSRDRY